MAKQPDLKYQQSEPNYTQKSNSPDMRRLTHERSHGKKDADFDNIALSKMNQNNTLDKGQQPDTRKKVDTLTPLSLISLNT